jgi:hypothetical protein
MRGGACRTPHAGSEGRPSALSAFVPAVLLHKMQYCVAVHPVPFLQPRTNQCPCWSLKFPKKVRRHSQFLRNPVGCRDFHIQSLPIRFVVSMPTNRNHLIDATRTLMQRVFSPSQYPLAICRRPRLEPLSISPARSSTMQIMVHR